MGTDDQLFSHDLILGMLDPRIKPLFELQEEADHLRAEAEALNNQTRLEDLTIWVMEKVKTTKKGSKTYGYWMASWRNGGRVQNVHLGSCAKLDEKTALQKARKMKAEALRHSAQS